jgi:hypothetical protein
MFSVYCARRWARTINTFMTPRPFEGRPGVGDLQKGGAIVFMQLPRNRKTWSEVETYFPYHPHFQPSSNMARKLRMGM